MAEINHTAGMLATTAIELVNEEGMAAVFLRGIPEPFMVTSLGWLGDQVSYVLVAGLETNQSLHFDAAELIAVRAPEV